MPRSLVVRPRLWSVPLVPTCGSSPPTLSVLTVSTLGRCPGAWLGYTALDYYISRRQKVNSKGLGFPCVVLLTMAAEIGARS